jgi:hypothetical protein
VDAGRALPAAPEDLLPAIRAVLRDLQLPSPIALNVGWDARQGYVTFSEPDYPGGAGSRPVEPWWECPASGEPIARIGELTLRLAAPSRV